MNLFKATEFLANMALPDSSWHGENSMNGLGAVISGTCSVGTSYNTWAKFSI